MKKLVLAAAAATVIISSAAVAAVNLTISGNTISGFVGKGDVQTAYGINNATMQLHAEGTTFVYSDLQNYEYVCTWTTGEGTRGEKVHNVTRTRSGGLTSTIMGDPRKTGQWTGWNVSGTLSGNSADVPAVGALCPGNQDDNENEKAVGNGAVVSSVTALGGGTATLTATNALGQRVIPITSLIQ